MKLLRKCLIGLALLLSLAALLLWFLPARWILPWVEPQLHGLHLQQVQGLVWDGRAGQVLAADGHPLGQLRWRLSRRALLGRLQMQLVFDGPQLTFSGGLVRLPDGQVAIRGLTLRADAVSLDPYLKSPFGQPRGELQVTMDRALLQGGWPLQLQAVAQWQDAAMRTRDGDVVLGKLELQAQAQGGVIEAALHDDEHGPLSANGQLQLSPLGWRLDATLRSRQTDPALRRWLGRLGPLSSDGSVHIQHRGGLIASPPSPDQDASPP